MTSTPTSPTRRCGNVGCRCSVLDGRSNRARTRSSAATRTSTGSRRGSGPRRSWSIPNERRCRSAPPRYEKRQPITSIDWRLRYVLGSWRISFDVADPSSHDGSVAQNELSSLAGLGQRAQVRLDGGPALGEQLLGLVVGDGRADDDVLAVLPVRRRGDLVLGGELQGVDDAKDLVEVAAGRRRI